MGNDPCHYVPLRGNMKHSPGAYMLPNVQTVKVHEKMAFAIKGGTLWATEVVNVAANYSELPDEGRKGGGPASEWVKAPEGASTDIAAVRVTHHVVALCNPAIRGLKSRRYHSATLIPLSNQLE
jgi:hypothetical protein